MQYTQVHHTWNEHPFWTWQADLTLPTEARAHINVDLLDPLSIFGGEFPRPVEDADDLLDVVDFLDAGNWHDIIELQ